MKFYNFQDFKRISDEIIQIECSLRVTQPELSLCVAEIQDHEKIHLELVKYLFFILRI